MSESMLQEEARRAQAACARFEADLSAFADGEKTTLDGEEIARHVESCDACRAYVNALAGLTRVHLFGALQEQDDALPSGTELWGDLTRRLLEDNCARLAGVLYELGKALVAAGLRTSSELRGVQVFARKPGSIRKLSRKGETLFREHRDLAAKTTRESGDTLGARRGAFPAGERLEAAEAFESGRACLEQCLRLDPARQEARIYLAKYFCVAGRFDRARQLLRTVLHSPAPESKPDVRFFALQQLSRLYSMTHQFEQALELEREVLSRAEQAKNELFQAAALTNMSIYCVKLGRLDDAESAIRRLATDFRAHVETLAAPAYRRARDFKRALLRHKAFLTRLRERYPVMFAG